MEVFFLYENIFETIIKGSNTIFLDMAEDDFFSSYSDISMKAAEDITDYYFKMKQKDGCPKVLDIYKDETSHSVKITIEVNPKQSISVNPYYVPDSLNIRRNQ